MRVGYVSLGNPEDRTIWSGTPHYSLREMQKRFTDLEVFNTDLIDKVVHAANKPARLAGLDLSREPLVTRSYAALLQERLKAFNPDAILSVGASNKLAYVECSSPIVHVSDALFGTVTRYYSRYDSMSDRSRQLGDLIQQRLIDKAQAILLTSEWAVESARQLYRCDGVRMQVVPIGANLEQPPGDDVLHLPKDKLRLLFVGIDWLRKGGPLVLQMFDRVRAAVADAELHIVGGSPADALNRPGVIVHGFLRKADPEQNAKLESLYRDAALFVMPSREEAFGLVYCEAAAYGVPAVALRTGGVSTVVRDGESGLLFPADVTAEVMANRILSLWNSKSAYEQMRKAARTHFLERLNWSAWGDAVEGELRMADSGASRSRTRAATTGRR